MYLRFVCNRVTQNLSEWKHLIHAITVLITIGATWDDFSVNYDSLCWYLLLLYESKFLVRTDILG